MTELIANLAQPFLGRNKIARTIVLFVILLLSVSCPASNKVLFADVIWIKGRETPVFGKLVSSNDTEVVFRAYENGQLQPGTKLQKSLVEQLVVNFDATRLEGLDPSQPNAYRDYAEELIPQSDDPVARQLARRLLLIAAFQSSRQTDSSDTQNAAMKMLVQLADSESEKRQLEMIRFLNSPNSQTNPFENSEPIKLVRALRQEQPGVARSLLLDAENRKTFRLWNDELSLESLDQVLKVNRPSKSQLNDLLRVEAGILRQLNVALATERSNRSRKQNWGDFAFESSTDLTSIPRFENVTEFDPTESVYRNGIWVRPN
jgi:hypothetical protein